MLNAIKGYFERRRIRRILGKYVSPKVTDDLLNGELGSPQIGQLDKKTLGIALVLFGYSSHDEVAKNIGVVAGLADEFGAGREAATNGLMVFCFGRFPHEQNIEEKRVAFVQAIQTKLGSSVKIVHGTGTGHVGLVGSEKFLVYTFLMPKFNDALHALASLQNGEAREVAFS